MLGLVASMVGLAMKRNAGKWIYPLDDAYIHMATIKHLVQHGVFGVSYLNGFSSCSSSLVYPCLLAGSYWIFGVNTLAPLVLNLIAATAAIYYAAVLIRRYSRFEVFTFLTLVSAVVITPLHVVLATGMEHTWQILIDLFFLDLAVRVLARDEPAISVQRAGFYLPAAAGLAVTIRFEGLFFVAIVGLLLLCRRRVRLAIAVGVGAALPLTLFGAYASTKGWPFLPTSILLKGGSHTLGLMSIPFVALVFVGMRWRRAAARIVPVFVAVAILACLFSRVRESIGQSYETIWHPVIHHLHMFVLLGVLAATLYWQYQLQRVFWRRPVLLLTILLTVALQHMAFAGIGWVYRYEAYLMFLGIVVVGIALADAYPEMDLEWLRRQSMPWCTAACAWTAVAFVPWTLRALSATRTLAVASHNIYDQQYQMSRFVKTYYNGAGVAANDVGFIDFSADLRVLDTWGLASYEVFRARRKHALTAEVMRALATKEKIQLVMGYESWMAEYSGPLPEWVLVGRWQIPNNMVCGSDTVSFYAPDAGSVAYLTHALRTFAPELPPDVVQTGPFQTASQ